MKNIKTILAAGLVFIGSAANATVINFLDIANSGEYGATPLTYGNLSITGTKNGADAYPYLDSGDAGLGVCGVVTTSLQCNPGSDDNVTQGEFLTFTFDVDTMVNSISVNTNHDPINHFQTSANSLKAKNDVVSFNGADTAVTTYGSKINFNDLVLTPFFVAAGTSFNLGYENKQFYVSKIDFTTVPEPATLGLIALGVAGIGAARRRKQAA